MIKICGLSDADALDAALGAGADMVGFVHFPPSPRHVALDRGARLSAQARGRALRVALLVDPSDEAAEAVVAALDPDLVQLHGAETPDRVAQLRTLTGRPVMKAVGVAERGDLAAIETYRGRADRLLVDAKPPKGALLPGGNGVSFDWTLLAGLDPALPLVLSGGLSADNVAEAVAATGVMGVDVSSGVESRPGVKDPARIAAFVAAARQAFAHRDSAHYALKGTRAP